MEKSWDALRFSLGLLLCQLCNGLPINSEDTVEDSHTQLLTGLVAVLLTICSVVFLAGCLCCQRKNGFKEFRDSPVVASTASNLDHGHVNPVANGEFTIFTPLSPPHQNNNVFLANQQIITRTAEDYTYGDVDVSSWFNGTESDFPRIKLKYIKEIGKGWFGRVVEGAAQDIDGQQRWTPVVVRILEATASSKERVVFLHDASIYRCGPHPNILKLWGRCLDTIPLLLLQEYCPQGDLKLYLRQNQATAEKLLTTEYPLVWCCQLTSALKHLHDNKITHPDLSARNCQLTSNLTVKLGDYGLSVFQYPEDYYEGAPGLPLRWCAPETLSYTPTTIEPKKVTLESNIWSLAVTMWEICSCGEQPYGNLTDDEVIAQVLGSPKVRLGRPKCQVLYTDYIFRLMQLCWTGSESRPAVSQIDLMLTDLLQVYKNTSSTQMESCVSVEDFDRRWEAFKPNSIVKTDNHVITDSTSIDMEDEIAPSKPLSPSLNNLHGSLDNLLHESQMESWLENVATKTGDMSFVKGLSEAIKDLDNALALENSSSSNSSPAPEQAKMKLEFKLGPLDDIINSKPLEFGNQNDSLTDSMVFVQRTSSESETEEENWKKKIERGAYTEKVKQKSRSVADLMILTHIDQSESESETPQPSLDYRANYKNVRFAPKTNLENVSMTFGSEGNLLNVHDTFQDELKKLREERRDSLLFVPETHSQSSSDSLMKHPQRILQELNSPSEMQPPPNQVYNVFNVTIDKFSPIHSKLNELINFKEVPKLSDIIQSNSELVSYLNENPFEKQDKSLSDGEDNCETMYDSGVEGDKGESTESLGHELNSNLPDIVKDSQKKMSKDQHSCDSFLNSETCSEASQDKNVDDAQDFVIESHDDEEVSTETLDNAESNDKTPSTEELESCQLIVDQGLSTVTFESSGQLIVDNESSKRSVTDSKVDNDECSGRLVDVDHDKAPSTEEQLESCQLIVDKGLSTVTFESSGQLIVDNESSKRSVTDSKVDNDECSGRLVDVDHDKAPSTEEQLESCQLIVDKGLSTVTFESSGQLIVDNESSKRSVTDSKADNDECSGRLVDVDHDKAPSTEELESCQLIVDNGTDKGLSTETFESSGRLIVDNVNSLVDNDERSGQLVVDNDEVQYLSTETFERSSDNEISQSIVDVGSKKEVDNNDETKVLSIVEIKNDSQLSKEIVEAINEAVIDSYSDRVDNSVCREVPKLMDLIQNNDALMDYIIAKYESETLDKSDDNFDSLEEVPEPETKVTFDTSENQDEAKPNSLTHSSVFTSTPFGGKKSLPTPDRDGFSSLNLFGAPETEKSGDNLYSLETWDNFLGKALDKSDCENLKFDSFSSEPQSLLFIENPDESHVCDKNNSTFVLDVNDIKVDLEDAKNGTWESTGGWFLHPQSNPDDVTGEMTIAPGATTDSYVGFNMDDEIMAAIRTELLTKLPQAQVASNGAVGEDEEWDSVERNEVFLRYNVNTPLSPIPEESFIEDDSCDSTPRQEQSDDDDESDWSEHCEREILRQDESPVHHDHGHLHRHTPSQDSCCSNDTLFNLEELTCVGNDTETPPDNVIHQNINTESEKTDDKAYIVEFLHNERESVPSFLQQKQVAPLPSPEDKPWKQLPASLLTYQNMLIPASESSVPEPQNIDDIVNEADYVNIVNLENTKNSCKNDDPESEDYDVDDYEQDTTFIINNDEEDDDKDVFGVLTDIRFNGPGDNQLMSTSFSESNDLNDEQDWDSGSDTRSSSSGEFIWKEGEHEESLKALRAAPQDVLDDVKPMEGIQEETSSESSGSDDEEGENPEFVPSAWDKYATPTKSALRSPEKTLEKTDKKKAKGVWFKKQKYHCVYEYPREPDSPVFSSPVLNNLSLWKPQQDYSAFADWDLEDVDAPENPNTDETDTFQTHYQPKSSRNLNLYQLSSVPDFIQSSESGLDDEFFISSSAKPFDMIGGLTSQFFPGNWASQQENATPDSGVEDITTPDKNYVTAKTVQSLKSLAAEAVNRGKKSEKNVDVLGGLRHTRDRLKLDLPPSPSAFTSSKMFNIEPAFDPVATREKPAFTTFGKSRFLVQHVETPPDDEHTQNKNVSFEALPYKPIQRHILSDFGEDKNKIESVRGEASLLDSADEDSGIESSTLERKLSKAVN